MGGEHVGDAPQKESESLANSGRVVRALTRALEIAGAFELLHAEHSFQTPHHLHTSTHPTHSGMCFLFGGLRFQQQRFSPLANKVREGRWGVWVGSCASATR